MNPLAPLADRSFRLVFAGEMLSSFGSGIHIVALNWYVLDRTGSAAAVSVVFALALGAGLVALPVSGLLADRYRRRTVVVAADLLRLASVGSLALLALAGDPPLAAIYALTFVTGFGHALFWPAVMALLQEVIPPRWLTEASGLVEVMFQAGSLAGAALGGPLLIRLGLGGAMAVDAATYAASAAAILAVSAPLVRPEAHAPLAGMVRDGLAYLRAHRPVAVFGLVSTVPFVATISLNVVIVAYALGTLGRDATVYGLLDMTYGAGALASGFVAALVVVRLGERAALVGFMAAVVVAYALFATGPTQLAAAFALSFVAGFGSSAFRVVANAALLRIVPNALMGRTSAVFQLGTTVLQVAMAAAVGPLIDAGGTDVAFAALAALVAAGLAALVGVLPALPAARDPAPAAEGAS